MRTRMSWDWVGDIPVGIYTTWVDHKHFKVEIKKGTRRNQNDNSIAPSAPSWKKFTQRGLASKDEVVERCLSLCEIWLKELGEYQEWDWQKEKIPNSMAYQKEEKVYIKSNVTPEEFFEYYCTDENAKRFYEEALEKHTDEVESKAIDELQKREELLEEQLFFARELIDDIERTLKQSVRLKEFKAQFDVLVSDSMFER